MKKGIRVGGHQEKASLLANASENKLTLNYYKLALSSLAYRP
jgi:hypothetical protein